MSTAVAAAPVDQKRKKANKISQQPPPPQPSAGPGGPDGPPVTSVEHSLSSSMGTGAWSGHVAQDPHDEVPIVKKGPSTFDELLERELARDQASQAAQPSKSSSRATFLKRGALHPALVFSSPCACPASDTDCHLKHRLRCRCSTRQSQDRRRQTQYPSR